MRVRPILEWLRARHRVTLLCADHFPALSKTRPGFWQRLRGLADFSHPCEFRPAFEDAVRDVVQAEQFDALLPIGAAMLQYIPPEPRVVVADLVDEPVLSALRDLKALRGRAALLMAKHAVSSYLYERRWQPRLAAAIVVSERDARMARRVLPGVPVRRIANGVDAAYFCPSPHAPTANEIVFSGNMGFAPNISAALYFADRVFPLIRRLQPPAHWTIVGSQPHPAILALQEREGISVTGWVPDIRPWVQRASVYVSPLVAGSGIKNKVLEAWAMQKAVVATPLGCAGICARDGHNILVANNAAEFAEKTVALLRDVQRADTLGREARRTVEAEYRWQDKAAEVETLLLDAVRQSA
ncbi:MAG: glycosyltransferase [Acidobacteriota bacterium]|nr:glycosyltransferase [Acidobacteriota bacterium]